MKIDLLDLERDGPCIVKISNLKSICVSRGSDTRQLSAFTFIVLNIRIRSF